MERFRSLQVSVAGSCLGPCRGRVYRRRGKRLDDDGRNAVQSLPDKPSIAVLPFDNIGNDPKWDRLADAITEDIISDLSRYDKLRTMPNLIRVKSCNLQRPKASG